MQMMLPILSTNKGTPEYMPLYQATKFLPNQDVDNRLQQKVYSIFPLHLLTDLGTNLLGFSAFSKVSLV